MFINCKYDMKRKKVVYQGFEVTHRSKPELNKTFQSENPPKDYRDACAYAVEHATDYCTSSSSVDDFVMDSDEFGWYTNEFGEEWFDYLDNLPDLEQAAGEKRQTGINSLVFYFQNTLGVNDAFANALAESTYNEFGRYIIQRVVEYQSTHSKNQSEQGTQGH